MQNQPWDDSKWLRPALYDLRPSSSSERPLTLSPLSFTLVTTLNLPYESRNLTLHQCWSWLSPTLKVGLGGGTSKPQGPTFWAQCLPLALPLPSSLLLLGWMMISQLIRNAMTYVYVYIYVFVYFFAYLVVYSFIYTHTCVYTYRH